MKTFPSYDYTLCNNEECKKKKTCVRYLTYQKAVKEKYPYMITLHVPKAKEECSLYVKSK